MLFAEWDIGFCLQLHRCLRHHQKQRITHSCWTGRYLVIVSTHGRSRVLLGCLLPQGQKVNVTGILTPESKSKLITCRYRQKPPRIFPQPTYDRILFKFSLHTVKITSQKLICFKNVYLRNYFQDFLQVRT